MNTRNPSLDRVNLMVFFFTSVIMWSYLTQEITLFEVANSMIQVALWHVMIRRELK